MVASLEVLSSPGLLDSTNTGLDPDDTIAVYSRAQ
jgi:hypothetical protein